MKMTTMSTFNLRISQKEKEILKDFAKMQGKSASRFLKDLVFEAIEKEMDKRLYEEAVELLKNDNGKEDMTLEEVMKKYPTE